MNHLFDTPRRETLFHRILGKVLHIANSEVRDNQIRPLFYGVKDRVLQRFGTGELRDDIQHIELKCRGCYGCGIWRKGSWNEDTCFRCGGTGVYQHRYIRLERWTLGGFKFHIPRERLEQKPEQAPTIEGKIDHWCDHPNHAFEYQLLLILLFNPRAFFSMPAHLYEFHLREMLKSRMPLQTCIGLMAIVWAFCIRLKWFMEHFEWQTCNLCHCEFIPGWKNRQRYSLWHCWTCEDCYRDPHYPHGDEMDEEIAEMEEMDAAAKELPEQIRPAQIAEGEIPF